MIIGQQYKILAELGSGGMGIVYHGVDVMLEREVAVKKLRSEFSSSAEVAERFRREAKIQARLNHPNLAHLYSFFKENNSLYIVMEFVEGVPLSRLCPMPWRQALPLFVQILDGVEFAHSLNVLHRDIKPDNIMVNSRGEVKVMDFGIAHLLGWERQTREKSIVGTLEYVSPELIGGKEISPQSDIYSLGIVLFEMISGKLPFEADSEFALLLQHLEAPVPRLGSVAADIPDFLEEAISCALAKLPEERFASCRAMAEWLRTVAPEVLTGAQELTVLPPRGDEVERSVRRIDALISGGELDLAGTVLDRAMEDYPDMPALLRVQESLRQQRVRRTGDAPPDEKTSYVAGVLAQLNELEAAGSIESAAELSVKALERYPQVPALRIAQALFAGSASE